MTRSTPYIRAGVLALALTLIAAASSQASVFIQPGLHPEQLNPSVAIPYGTPAVDALHTDNPTTCATGPKPGATDMFHFLNYWWPRGENDGIFNCRKIGDTNLLSLHGEGRAVDFHLDKDNAGDLDAAQAIRRWFLADDTNGVHYAMARRFGIQEMIFNKHIWTSARASEGWRDYAVPPGGDPHYTHIHIGLTRAAANRSTTAWLGFYACRPGQTGCRT
jgi:hypothetical protein